VGAFCVKITPKIDKKPEKFSKKSPQKLILLKKNAKF